MELRSGRAKQATLGFVCKKPVTISPNRKNKNKNDDSCSPDQKKKNDFSSPDQKKKSGLSCSTQRSSEKKTVKKTGVKPKLKMLDKNVKKVALVGGDNEKDKENKEEKRLVYNGNETLWSDDDDDLDDLGEDTVVDDVVAKVPKAAELHLPEKYAMLAEFFEAMESAIKLLRIRRSASCFTNICPQVEMMTSRRFTYSHVAQMKHVLPDALLLEKFMIKDERSLCMKPDLKIVLTEAPYLKNDAGAPLNSVKDPFFLRRMFYLGLEEFVQNHPNGEDVPEEVLPEPFNKKRQPVIFPVLPKQTFPIVGGHQEPQAISSLLPKSFKSHFSVIKPKDLTSLSENLKLSNVEKAAIPDKDSDFSFPSVTESETEMSVDSKTEKDIAKPKEAAHNLETQLCMTPQKEIILSPKQTPKASVARKGLKMSVLETPNRNSFILSATPRSTPVSDVHSVSRTPRKSVKSIDFASPVAQKELPRGNTVLSPRTPGFASPEPCDALKSSGGRLTRSEVKRSMAFGKVLRDCSLPLSPLASIKRKAPENTENEQNFPLSYASSRKSSEAKYATLNGETSLLSPRKTPLNVVKVEESTPLKCATATPPLSTMKRRRYKLSEALSPPTQALFSETRSETGEGFNSDTVVGSSNDPEQKVSNVGKQDPAHVDQVVPSKKGILDIISSDLIRSVQEKEKKIKEDLRLGIPAAKKRQQMLGSLPKLFNVIRDIYRTSKRSVLTRQELLHKVISFHTDVIDRAEVEEQLQLLEEIVPEWISGKVASSGDILYSVETSADLQKIQSRLVSTS